MLENNIYNIDREFDYATIKSIVLKSLQNIAKEEALKGRPSAPDEVIFDYVSVNHIMGKGEVDNSRNCGFKE
jgi:hypothetical protein